jgi:hypothetical protein
LSKEQSQVVLFKTTDRRFKKIGLLSFFKRPRKKDCYKRMLTGILGTASPSLAEIVAPAGALFTDMWTLVAIAMGIGLFFYAVPRMKRWLAHR